MPTGGSKSTLCQNRDARQHYRRAVDGVSKDASTCPGARALYARAMSNYLQVSTTAENRETAAHLAGSAVAAQLAAGAQVQGPVTSFFWHKGELGEGQEWQVTLKTTAARYPALEAHLIAEHSWTNPEVTAVSLAAGSQAYLDWLTRMTAASESEA